MKNKLTAIAGIAFMLLFCCSTFAQTAKNITISISGIEFDDANFAALKDNLKTNQKARNIQQSYNAGTAKISLAYPGSATDLWDDLPAAVKQLFKLNSIDA